jgi:glycosyltransferase involved in cell wall biosynthesis
MPTMTMKVALDATPLLGPRTGVGHYVACLVRALAALDPKEPELEEVALIPFSWRGTRDLPNVSLWDASRPGGRRASSPANSSDSDENLHPVVHRVDFGLGAAVPVRFGRRRVPARLLRACWGRVEWPPVEWFAGSVDVFHATNFVAPPARRAGLVMTVHDLTYLRYPEMVSAASARYRELVPRGIARGAVVCTPTAAVAAEVAETYRVPPERLAVTPLGVGPEWLEAEPPDPAWLAARGLPARYLLFVGSREPRKNLATLLAAYRRLPDGAGRPALVLAGPPGWGEALDLRGVITPGYLPDDDLVRVVAGAAALVFPSWYEGFGLPPLQAFATGTPVVAADIPAIREVTGDQAELVDPADADALAAALAKVLAAGDGGPAARAARRAHAASFTWQATAHATLGAYRLAAQHQPEGVAGRRP